MILRNRSVPITGPALVDPYYLEAAPAGSCDRWLPGLYWTASVQMVRSHE